MLLKARGNIWNNEVKISLFFVITVHAFAKWWHIDSLCFELALNSEITEKYSNHYHRQQHQHQQMSSCQKQRELWTRDTIVMNVCVTCVCSSGHVPLSVFWFIDDPSGYGAAVETSSVPHKDLLVLRQNPEPKSTQDRSGSHIKRWMYLRVYGNVNREHLENHKPVSLVVLSPVHYYMKSFNMKLFFLNAY